MLPSTLGGDHEMRVKMKLSVLEPRAVEGYILCEMSLIEIIFAIFIRKLILFDF